MAKKSADGWHVLDGYDVFVKDGRVEKVLWRESRMALYCRVGYKSYVRVSGNPKWTTVKSGYYKGIWQFN